MALLSRAQHKYEYAGQACLVPYVLCWYCRFSHCTNFLCEILVALALLFFLLRFLTPRGTYFLLNFSYANPREAAHVLTTIDFEQLVLCVTLHILPHSADLLAGAATAIEHAATIFRAAVNREQNICRSFADAHGNSLSDAPAHGKVDISHACVQRRLEQAFGFADA